MVTIKWSQERQTWVWRLHILCLAFAFFVLPWAFSLALSSRVTFLFDVVFPPADLGFDSSSALVTKALWTGHVRRRPGDILHVRPDKTVPERKRVRLSIEDSMNVEQHFELLGYCNMVEL